ncbi:aspartate 1-decarboxylase [Lusitaniella coriacea LEGE 07157]|uniref:Aspartate 1-decarboxylase n=1 Tax=Lusitaniella coriacea LEGE 07157 TaxID=945747 RepID=A0A8J7E1K3_9CYAN|nr:aspartate 1-decarboxylase [Lusitaniella coriacea]MBE9118876.1 aspartate 1-decarboxylase [Lusitaniella coriacea LEGE 07157]
MQRTLLLAKIHNCTLTDANLEYLGSISIDRALLDAAGILAYEQVQVVNKTNGNRLMTYAIEAPAHSGIIELNGAAARLGMKGDALIIMTYGQLNEQELETYAPTVVFVDGGNRPVEIRHGNELQFDPVLASTEKL